MRFRNWLLTGTSLGLLAFATLSVRAQDDGLVAAYQVFIAAQAAGDAAATETAQAALTEQCIIAGYATFEDCLTAAAAAVALLPPAVTADPAMTPEPEPVVEPTPEPVPEPVAEPEPVVEEAPAPIDIAAQLQGPVDAYSAAVAGIGAGGDRAMGEADMATALSQIEAICLGAGYVSIESCLADYGIALPAEPEPVVEPAPEPVPEPVVEPVVEPTPETAVEPTPEPVVEPAVEPAAPAEASPAAVDISADLQGPVDSYSAAVADVMAGGDRATAEAIMANAFDQIAAICLGAGYDSVGTCLADYGIALPILPDPVATEPAIDPATLPIEPVEVIEDLPVGITQEQIAPVLDSAKDIQAAPAGEPEVAAVPAAPLAPPPVDDQASQANIIAPEGAIESVASEAGQIVDIQQLAAPQVPQNVTIINQTNVTNTVINNVQNNTVNNNTTNNGDIYNNVLNQVILQVGVQLIVENRGQDTDRFLNPDGEDEIFYENLDGGRVRETIIRADGSQIITVRNRNGDILRRSRIDADGREYVLAYFDDRYEEDLLEWRDPGIDLPPLRLTIPVDEYVLDSSEVDEEEVTLFFRQPPVEQVARIYSIDEVKRSARIRDSVRKLEVGGLTFDSGAATIGRDQVRGLSKVAGAMRQMLLTNPAETFLIEGHTDAVGSEISNLQLSDLRAATVARILTDFYQIPPENLATQGYGERYLKIRTELGERENRRVTIRRITPLVTFASN